MYLTINQAAEHANRSTGTIHRWLKIGQLTRYKVGYRVYVDANELDALLTPTRA